MDRPIASNEVERASDPRPILLDSLTRSSLRGFFSTLAGACIILVGCAWIWAANGRMWFLDPEYAMWQAKIEMVERCELGDTVVLGASRAMAGVLPNQLGGSVSNLALGGSSPIENFYMMQRVARCPTPPRRAVMAFLPLFLTRAQTFWERSALFGFLDFDELEEIRTASVRLSDSMLYSSSPWAAPLGLIENYSYHVGLPSYYFAAMVKGRLVGRKARNDLELARTLNSRGQHFFGSAESSNGVAEDALMTHFAVKPVLDDYMVRLLDLLHKEKIETYFASPPLNPATFALMDRQVAVNFVGYLRSLEARFPNFHVLGQALQEFPADHFGDPEHLNPIGAARWTASLREQLTRLPAR